jgi:tetratricopeptide (TPR) repeat protein
MSLLLQALQKASKTREDAGSDPTDKGAEDGLSLEPLAEPTLNGQEEAPRRSPTRAQAATVMRAAETPAYGPIDWAREHYMLTFLGAAILVAIAYGTYVYIQVSNPGFLRSTPQPAPLQALAQPPGSPAPAQPTAKISGIGALEPLTNPSPAPPSPETTAAKGVVARTTNAEENSRARPRIVSKPRLQAAALNPEPERTEDEEGLETIEIPASPQMASVAASVPESASSSDGQEIAVRRQSRPGPGIDPTLAAAYQALLAGDYALAKTLYREVHQTDVRNTDALLGLAAIASKEGRNDEASSLYGRVLEVDPRNAHAQAGLIALVGGTDPAAAEQRLKQLISREPAGFLYFTLGNLYAEQRQWPAAQQAYFQAYQFSPDNPDYAFNLAVGLEHLGQPNLALDYYRKALDLSFRKGRANFDQSLAIERVGQLSSRIK